MMHKNCNSLVNAEHVLYDALIAYTNNTFQRHPTICHQPSTIDLSLYIYRERSYVNRYAKQYHNKLSSIGTVEKDKQYSG